MKKILDQVMRGELGVFYDEKLKMGNDNIPLDFFNNDLKKNFIAPELQDTLRRWEEMFCNEVGIPNIRSDKKERMIVDEVNSNNIECFTKAELWLETLKGGLSKPTKNVQSSTLNCVIMKGGGDMGRELYLQGLLAWNENLLKDNFISHLPVNMVNDIGKDNIQNYVLSKRAKLEFLIPSPTEMALALNSWASVNERLFSIIYDIELAISTTEGAKTETITRDRKGKSETEDKENLKQESNSGTSGSDSTVEKVAGFNSTSLVDKGSTTITYGGKASYDETNNNRKKF